MRSFSKLFITFLIAIATYAQAQHTVDVKILKDKKVTLEGVGAFVMQDKVVTSLTLINLGDSVLFVDQQTGKESVGYIIKESESDDLALLGTAGLTGEPFVLAKDLSEVGRKVFVQGNKEKKYAGAITRITKNESGRENAVVVHSAQYLDGVQGAPLLNNCGELLGITKSEKETFSSRLKKPKDINDATSLIRVKALLESAGIKPNISAQTCLPQEVLVQNAEEAKKQQEEIAAQEKAAREKAQTEKEAAERAAQLAQKEREEAEKAKEEAEKAKEEAGIAKEKADKAAEKAKEEKEEAENKQQEEEQKRKEAEETQKEQERLREEAEEEKQKAADKAAEKTTQTKIIAGVAGLVILLTLIIAFILNSKKKKRLTETGKNLARTRQEAEVQRGEAEKARIALEANSASFSDIVLVGVDEDGIEHRLKINGSALARSDGGQILGRDPNMCDLVINQDQLSRKHLRFIVENNELFAEDLGSSNGTSINNSEMPPGKRVLLRHGDSLRLGTLDCQVMFAR